MFQRRQLAAALRPRRARGGVRPLEATGEVHEVVAYDRDRGDFASAHAERVGPDTYRLLGDVGTCFREGDEVRCELSDGELVVLHGAARPRLLEH